MGIAAARAELAPETEAGMREVLDRLGDPHAIAAEARIQLGLPPSPAAWTPARATAPAAAGRAMPPPRPPGPPPGRPAVVPPPPPPAQSSKIGTWILAVTAVVVTVLLAVCCVGAGLYAMRGDHGGPLPGEQPLRPRPTLSLPR